MSFVRSIGKFGLTALIVNSIIGSGIFGVPAELIRLVGRASPIAILLAGLVAAVIMACFAEVASQFSDPGGPYLYVRTALGKFAGTQAGWFFWACFLVAAAANANLFVIYLSGVAPWAEAPLARALVILGVVAIPTLANYVGVRSGSSLSTVFCIAKLIPLAAIVLLGMLHFGRNAVALPASELAQPGISGWLNALLFLGFSFDGFEFALTPGAEVVNPRRTVPVAMAAAFLVVLATYTSVQFVTVATLGNTVSARPLADVAGMLFGPNGRLLVSIGAMISTYGFISATVLSGPRLTYAFAERGDFPGFFGALHPRYRTPHVSLLIFSALLIVISITGSFRWALAVGSGALLVTYALVCISLIRLRQTRPRADALRIPFGRVLAAVGVAIAIALVSRMAAREAAVLAITAMIAAMNWWWVGRQKHAAEAKSTVGG